MRQRKRRLTKEQEELRLSGLRILARLIARRHLADQRRSVDEEAAAPVGDCAPDVGAAPEEAA